jgi:MFS family permease
MGAVILMLNGEKNSFRYFACFAATIFSFYDLFQLSLMNSTAAGLAITYHLSSATLGLLTSAYLWANALGLIPIGILIDKFSVRPVAIFFISLSTLACFGIAYSHSWKIVMLMRFMQGLTSATSLLTCMRMAIRWFDKRANTAVGIMVMIALSGGIFGNDLFITVVHNIGWRQSFMIAGAMGIITLLLAISFLYEKKFVSSSTQRIKQQFIQLIINRKIIFLGGYLGFMSLAIFIFAAAWGNIYLQAMYQMTALQAGITAGFLFLGLMIGSPIIGIIADRFQDLRTLMKIGALLSFILILPIVYYYPLSQEEVMILFFMLGFISSIQNVVFVIIAKTTSSTTLSTATSATALVENTIGAFGQLLFGWLMHSSWQTIVSNNVSVTLRHPSMNATIIFPVAFIICLITVFLCPKEKYQ